MKCELVNNASTFVQQKLMLTILFHKWIKIVAINLTLLIKVIGCVLALKQPQYLYLKHPPQQQILWKNLVKQRALTKLTFKS